MGQPHHGHSGRAHPAAGGSLCLEAHAACGLLGHPARAPRRDAVLGHHELCLHAGQHRLAGPGCGLFLALWRRRHAAVGRNAPYGAFAGSQCGQEDLPGLTHFRDAEQPRQGVHLQRQPLHLSEGEADLQRRQQLHVAPAEPERADPCAAEGGYGGGAGLLVDGFHALGGHRAARHHDGGAQRHFLGRHLQHQQVLCNEAGHRPAG